MMTQTQEIEFFRILYQLGVISADDIVRYCDKLIANDKVADDIVFDLALCGQQSADQVSHLILGRRDRIIDPTPSNAVLGYISRLYEHTFMSISEIRDLSNRLSMFIPVLSEKVRIDFINIATCIDDLEYSGSEQEMFAWFRKSISRYSTYDQDLPLVG